MTKHFSQKTILCFLHILFIVVLALSIRTTIRFSSDILDDDASGELIFGYTLHDEKRLISQDWFFSTEYKINNQLIFGILFSFIEDWQTVRLIGICIIQLIYLCSFIFAMNSFGICWEAILYGCSLIFLPYCVAYGRIVLYHGFYAPPLTFSFLIAGFFIRACRCNKEQSFWFYSALFLFSFISALNGYRQLFITTAPICILSFFWAIRESRFNFLKNRVFRSALIVLFSSLLGFLVHTFVIIPRINLNGSNSFHIGFKGISELFTILFSILRQFAYRSGVSDDRVLWFFSLSGVAVLVFALIKSIRFVHEKTLPEYFVRGMLVVQLILHSVVFSFFELPSNSRFDYARYLLPASVWAIPLFCLLSNEKKIFSGIQKSLFIAVQFIFIANGIINQIYFQKHNLFSQEYDGLPFTDISSAKDYDEIASFIRGKGYTMGYGFLDTNVLTEKLDGLPIIPIEITENKLKYQEWLTRKSWQSLSCERAFIFGNINQLYSYHSFFEEHDDWQVYQYKDRIFVYEILNPDEFKAYLDKSSR